ncbi:hypothetical protein UPYG_G00055490 [Umbra pygmaea]|uniref:C2H2-type domain-containing protein n=1 Tax=Umbra pygmaea TaxID=75934 RepID=A0ABD0XT42_UMBPY
MEREKGVLMDEIEKSLWNLTEDNLRFLYEHHGQKSKDGSEVKRMDHRSLRRKILEEMWDNTDSMKSEEQGISWLFQLKQDISRLLEGAVNCGECTSERRVAKPSTGVEAEPVSPSQSDEDESADSDVEDSEWLPGDRLQTAPVNPTQSYDGALDGNEERRREVREWMTSHGAELPPDRNTSGHQDQSPHAHSDLPNPPGRGSRGSALLRCLNKRMHVQLGEDSKTSSTGETSDILREGKRPKKTLSGGRPSSHICHHCGKNLGSQKSLKSHMRVHTEEKPHGCSECGETFRLLRSLKKHQKLHTGEVRATNEVNIPHPCPHCKVTLASKKELKDHLRVHHTEKSQLCSECGKRFSSTYALRKHQRLHTGEQLHLCPDCGKTFYTQAHLISHQRVHAEHRDRPHICPVCGRGFTAASSLKSHQKDKAIPPYATAASALGLCFRV